jgi:hypothetical protein
MPAYPDPIATERFMELLLVAADAAGLELDVGDAAHAGWLVPEGEQLVVCLYEEDPADWLVSVKAIR